MTLSKTDGNALRGSLLADPDALPLLPPGTVQEWGRTLVVAPHPDDETLACGGALALLARAGVPVRVLCITDGTLSHPNSATYPAPRLKALREAEMQAALSALGVAPGSAEFMGYQDRHTPTEGEPGFSDAVRRVVSILTDWTPQTVLIPWRRDPHPDHRAASAIVRAALHTPHREGGTPHYWGDGGANPIRLLEWPLWAWAIAEPDDAPQPAEASAFRLDIAPALDKKQTAIACHASQVTNLIDDDPTGFQLTPDVLAHFAVPYEVFIVSGTSAPVQNL